MRAQIAGQLYRLTPASLARAWDAVHAYREAHPYEVKMPAVIDPKALTAPPTLPTRPARKGLAAAPATPKTVLAAS